MTDNDAPSIYDLECVDVWGKPLPLRQFAGRPLLIVNTASLCGFSTQFKGLETIWQKYKDQGLVVLGVPSNDFGRQEPGNSAAIVSLCSSKFGITFPLLAKTKIVGPEAHPLFQWIAEEGGFMGRTRWNFYKYVVDRHGKLQDWFLPYTTPETPRFEEAITKAVAQA